MEMDNVAADKRGTRRYQLEGLEGRIAAVTFVEIVNISLGGVSARIDRRFNLGSECALRLQHGKEGVSIKGTIVWSKLTGFRKNGAESVPEYEVGIRFTDTGAEAMAALVE